MHFQSYQPAPPLDRYVETFWYVSGYVPYQRDKILPTQNIELMFNLADPHRVYADVDDPRFSLNQNAWVCGLQRSYIVSEAVGRSDLVGIRFKPAGLHPFLGFPVNELDNLVVELDLIWGRWVLALQEQLYQCPTVTGRFQLMEQFLRRRYQEPDRDWLALQYASCRLSDVQQPLSVADLAAELGFSQRHFIQKFRSMVGLSPKLFARVNRFHQMLQLVGRQEALNWGEIAHACGYYDQAHFNKDFRTFSGLTPAAYLQLRRQYLGQVIDTADAVHFVPLQ